MENDIISKANTPEGRQKIKDFIENCISAFYRKNFVYPDFGIVTGSVAVSLVFKEMARLPIKRFFGDRPELNSDREHELYLVYIPGRIEIKPIPPENNIDIHRLELSVAKTAQMPNIMIFDYTEDV